MKLTKTQLRKIIQEEVDRLLTEQDDPITLQPGVVLKTIEQDERNAIDKEGREMTDEELEKFKALADGALDAVNYNMNRGFPVEVEDYHLIPVKVHNGLVYFEIQNAYNKYLVIGYAGPGHTNRFG
tara:strand:- start:765 stop:1142 length:378 start_codon:yes stop_codon:yes gene_type:complete